MKRAEVLDQYLARAPEPTIGTIADGRFVYVANSQWDEYADDGSRLPGSPLSRPRLLSLPIAP